MDKIYYNTISDLGLQRGGYYLQKIKFFEKALTRVKDKSKNDLLILDLACNDGELTKIYAGYGKITGIDLNEGAVCEARKKGIEAIVGDVLQLNSTLAGREFDVVIAGDIIEHLFDTDMFLYNAYSVLRKGGTLLLSTPNLVSLGRRMMSLIGVNPFCEYSSQKNGINVGHIRYYTYDNLSTQLKAVGFRDIRILSDTLNLPLASLDKIMANSFPKLGRELLVECKK